MTSMPSDLDWGDSRELARSLPRLYQDLRVLADHYLKRERRAHTLQPTALVHEVFLKLMRSTNLKPGNSAQFFSVAARAMRQVLVDHARRFKAAKRGGGRRILSLDELGTIFEQQEVDLVALDEALAGLGTLDPRQCAIVELRFFGGLTVEQTAEVLGISGSSVKREWQAARAWLYRELTRDDSAGEEG